MLCACGTRRAYRWVIAGDLAAVECDVGPGAGWEDAGAGVDGCVEDEVLVEGCSLACELDLKG